MEYPVSPSEKRAILRVSAFPARHFGDGVGRVAKLEYAAPVCLDGLAGQDVFLAKAGGIELDAIDQTKVRQTIANLTRLVDRFSPNDPVEVARLVQKGNASGGGWKGMLALVLHEGEYFFVDEQGCYTLDQLCEHGRILPSEKAEFSYVFKYIKKYFLKTIDGQRVAA